MRKISLGKHFTFFLIALLVFNSVGVAQSTQTQEMFRVTKVKASVQKRGIGEKSRVTVKLRNKKEIKGYISKIDDASFDVTAKTAGQTTPILYVDVERIQGAGLSKGAKIGIIAGAAVVIVIVVFVAEFKAHGY
jgi:hypothetical protein